MAAATAPRIIVVGGGLAGLSAGCVRLSATSITRVMLAGALALLSSFPASAKPRTKVIVLANIPVTSTYSWQVEGRYLNDCDGDGCSTYYNPATSGDANAQGAVVKLLLPDASIIIASCELKKDKGKNFDNIVSGDTATTMYRDCRVPNAQANIEAEIDGNKIKLFMQASDSSSGKASSETYDIKGTLRPSASSAISKKILADPNLKADLGANDAALANSPAFLATGAQPIAGDQIKQMYAAGQASRCIINTVPTNADIFIDGKKLSKSPVAFGLIKHDNGPRTITIQAAGYQTVTKQVSPDGHDIVLDLQLEPSAH